MNRARIGLLVAAAATIGMPAIVQAQDQRESRSDRGARPEGMVQPRGEDRQPMDTRTNAPVAPVTPAAAPVAAQPAQRQGTQNGYNGQRGRNGQQQYVAPANAPAGQPSGYRGDPRAQGYNPQGYRGDQRQGQPGGGYRQGEERRAYSNAPQNYRPGYDARGGYNGRPGYGYGQRDNDRRGSFRSDWRNDARYDWRSYRTLNRALFHAPRYVPPRAYGYRYGYRAFSIGYRLEPFFYDRSYWIDDPWDYRLPPADEEYRWVRYYNDVLLVDLETGEVVDVIHDFFF